MMRSILIFPKFKRLDFIQTIRSQIDPLYSHIRPHISVVFPFDSPIPDHDLEQVLATTLTGIRPFQVTFSIISGDLQHGYVWLAASQGSKMIKVIHHLLYTHEALAPFERKDLLCVPHITLGHLANSRQANLEIEKLKQQKLSFSTTINQISIEHILANDDSDEFYQQKLK